jgi:hypothetical protein
MAGSSTARAAALNMHHPDDQDCVSRFALIFLSHLHVSSDVSCVVGMAGNPERVLEATSSMLGGCIQVPRR